MEEATCTGTILGPIIFFFHTIGNAQIRAMLAKIFFCCPCYKGKSKYDRPPSGRRVTSLFCDPWTDIVDATLYPVTVKGILGN